MKLKQTTNFTPTGKPLGADAKREIVDDVLRELRNAYGDGSVYFGNDDGHISNIAYTTSGSIGVDWAIGLGGIPHGRIVELYGPESSGKTTLCLKILAEAQARGEYCAFIDMEHAIDPTWATRIGVNMSELVIAQPNSGEDALETAIKLVSSGVFRYVVIDSLAALVPRAEIEGDMSDQQMGLMARLIAKGLRKIAPICNQTKTTLLMTNQIREKIGGMSYGSNETTTGGRAPKHYASVRIDVRRIETIKQGETEIGARTKVRIKKNKVGPPLREVEFDIIFDEGISVIGEIIDYALEYTMIKKAGSFFKDDEGNTLAQGREALRKYLRANPDYTFKLHNKVLAEMQMPLLTVMPVYDKSALVQRSVAELDPKAQIAAKSAKDKRKKRDDFDPNMEDEPRRIQLDQLPVEDTLNVEDDDAAEIDLNNPDFSFEE